MEIRVNYFQKWHERIRRGNIYICMVYICLVLIKSSGSIYFYLLVHLLIVPILKFNTRIYIYLYMYETVGDYVFLLTIVS